MSGRQAMIRAGLPKETTAFTINKVCASGMKAIALAAASIKAGDSEVVIAGGMENMSDVPIGLPKARWGHRMDMPFGKTVDLMVFDALYEIFYGYHMGITAENIAARYNISREEQDKLSVESHTRARNAIKNGILKNEIVPVTIPQKKGNPIIFDTDERPDGYQHGKAGKTEHSVQEGRHRHGRQRLRHQRRGGRSADYERRQSQTNGTETSGEN